MAIQELLKDCNPYQELRNSRQRNDRNGSRRWMWIIRKEPED